MNHWVFVIKDDEFVFKKRIEHKKWPIFSSTKFRKYLEIGDSIIFYQAGKHGQKFLGTAIMKSKVKPILDRMDYYVELENIDLWKTQPSIRSIISKLSFIKNKIYWGIYFQGGVLKIDKKDHSIILKEVEKSKTKKVKLTISN